MRWTERIILLAMTTTIVGLYLVLNSTIYINDGGKFKAATSALKLRNDLKNNSYEDEALIIFAREQAERSQNVWNRCANVSIPLTKGSSNIYLDKADGLTYCPIYKVATSSWSNVLLRLANKSIDTQNWQRSMTKAFKLLTNSKAEQESKNTIRFSVVRHPFERLVSAYRSKFEGASKYYFYKLHGSNMVRYYRNLQGYTSRQLTKFGTAMDTHVKKGFKTKLSDENPLTNPIGPTFTEFVKYLLFSKFEDQHWREYYKHCSFCHIKYDYILKFENLLEESSNLLKLLKVRKDIQFTYENPTNMNKKSDSVLCSFFNQLEPSLVQKLYEKYQKDFYLFQYDKRVDQCEQFKNISSVTQE